MRVRRTGWLQERRQRGAPASMALTSAFKWRCEEQAIMPVAQAERRMQKTIESVSARLCTGGLPCCPGGLWRGDEPPALLGRNAP